MRAMMMTAVLAGAVGCATAPPSGPASPPKSTAMCLPCVLPCTPESSCNAPAVAAAPAPTPAAAPQAPPAAPAGAPTFSPDPGTFPGTQQVTLSSPTSGAVIHYTTDGSTPTESSPVYARPITVEKTTTIQALAIAPGAPASPVQSGAYTVSLATARVAVAKDKLELKDMVYFDTGKATIKPVSYSLLDEVATVLKSHDEVKRVEIEGHTDSSGDAAVNKSLSQQRAEAVRGYLVGKGVDSGRLDAKGYGAERPIAPNTTAKGRETNRRVEFKISN